MLCAALSQTWPWLAARNSVQLWPALQNEEHRVEEEEAETRVKLKAMREHHKKWEGTRDKRINSWRDFASNKKAKKSKPLGGIKPPKLKVPILSVAVASVCCKMLLRDVVVRGRCSPAKDAAILVHGHSNLASVYCCRWRTRNVPSSSGRQWSNSRQPGSSQRQSALWRCQLCA